MLLGMEVRGRSNENGGRKRMMLKMKMSSWDKKNGYKDMMVRMEVMRDHIS